jgi:boron transporter
MAQGSEFPLRKPPGFHYDFFLLGVTTFLAGLLGLPAPNGLIPQAPIHTKSLVVMGHPPKKEKDEEEKIQSSSQNQTAVQSRIQSRSHSQVDIAGDEKHPPNTFYHPQEIPIAVVEQRVSNLAQGSLCLVLLTGPFLHILNLIPRGV